MRYCLLAIYVLSGCTAAQPGQPSPTPAAEQVAEGSSAARTLMDIPTCLRISVLTDNSTGVPLAPIPAVQLRAEGRIAYPRRDGEPATDIRRGSRSAGWILRGDTIDIWDVTPLNGHRLIVSKGMVGKGRFELRTDVFDKDIPVRSTKFACKTMEWRTIR